MSGPRGPPRGFLGLGFSSGASGNVSRDLCIDCFSNIPTNIFGDMKNGCGQDFDLALRGNVGRYEVVDAASDVSMVSRWRIGLNSICEPN
jgi:hypothetical protein